MSHCRSGTCDRLFQAKLLRGCCIYGTHQARAAYERDYILKKLDENHGKVSRTAEVLGLERSHLYRKMKSLGIAAKE